MKTISEFRTAYEAVTYWWEPLDRPLLRACSDSPGHAAQNEVFAKIALVNRTYRANLHLGKKGAEWNLAGLLVAAEFDQVMAPLRAATEFSRATLPLIADVHEELVRIGVKATSRVNNSFAAKYLSFHCPEVVPIFDRFAYAGAWKLVGSRVRCPQHDNRTNYHFAYYAEAVLILADELRAGGVARPNLKFIDNVLYEALRDS